jgi:hypothetical protein
MSGANRLKMMARKIWIGIGVGGIVVGVLCAWGIWFLVQSLNASNGSTAGEALAQQQGNGPMPTSADAKLFGPIQRAQEAKLSRCLPMVSDVARATVAGANQSAALWNKDNADGRLFQSITSFVPPSNAGGPGLSILGAGAGPQGQCDAEAVVIQPTAQSCQALVDGFKKQNMTVQELNGFPFMPVSATNRLVLMPATGNSCVVVSVRAYYGK